jgi:hypothetical protein
MQLSIRGAAVAGGLLWGGALLFVGLINLASPTYGSNFLQVMGSVYPFFRVSRTLADVFIGGIDGLLDGAIAGLLFAWLYNLFAAPAAKV